MSDPVPLFSLDGDRLVPSEHTRGPWDPDHQHGGPAAALVARAVEAEVGPAFTVTRLTLELLRPLPIEPLAVRATVTKPGRRVVRVEAEIAAGEAQLVVASASAVRHTDLPVAAEVPADGRHDVLEPGPDHGTGLDFGAGGDSPAFHRTGMEVRLVGTDAGGPGPARAWFRLRRPLVAGEEPTGLQRAAAAADFGNGISWVLPYERWIFVNPDLTVHLARRPQGEWIALDALTLASDEGTAQAESVIYDRAGRLGRGVQSLILERRDQR